MIVYNISIKVEPQIEQAWVEWQKEEHIPDIMATGMFVDHKFYRLRDESEDLGPTYVLQFFAQDLDHYNKYLQSFQQALRQKAFAKWGNKFIGFRSVMEVVN
jgi:hypothetical protein